MASPLKISAEDRRLMALNGSGKWDYSPDVLLGAAYPEMGASVAKFRRLAASAGSCGRDRDRNRPETALRERPPERPLAPGADQDFHQGD